MAGKKAVLEISTEKPKHYFRPFYRAIRQGNSTLYQPALPNEIVVVGCGGNGGYLIPWIARYLSQSRSDEIRGINLTLIDGDKVEEKNLVRQNFLPDEQEQNKAVVMADRCNRNLGMNVRAIPEYMNATVLNQLRGHSLIFGCVDRHEVRKLLSHWVMNSRDSFYVDVGNELSAGQLFLSGLLQTRVDPAVVRENYGALESPTHDPILIHEFYPAIEKADVQKAAPSCADLTASGQQMMSVNLTAAVLAFKAFEALMNAEEIPYYEITFGQDNFRTHWIRDLKEGKTGRTGRPVLTRDE